MRIAFFGSPPFASGVLRALLASSHEPLMLVTTPERRSGRGRKVKACPLVALAESHGLAVARPADPHEPEFLQQLRELEADVFMIASYGKILKKELFEMPPQDSLNVHSSLLPRHRGASPIAQAILAGDAVTGVTVQRIVKRLDAGDLLHSLECPITDTHTTGSLLLELSELGGRAAVQALDLMESGEAVFTAQDEEQSTYAGKLAKTDGLIDWSKPADELQRFVRAMSPWPGARCLGPSDSSGSNGSNGRELTLLTAHVDQEVEVSAAETTPGTLLKVDGNLTVATGAGALVVTELKPAGKAAMPVKAFLNGARWQAGQQLSSPPCPA